MRLKNILFLLAILLPIALFSSCKKDTSEKPTPKISFYQWKSVFQPSDLEKKFLKDLESKRLYVKFFDVASPPNSSGTFLVPIATSAFREEPSLPLVPVVFLDNASLLQAISNPLTNLNVDDLAEKIVKRITFIANDNNLVWDKELQMDCDWTPSTRDTYFSLLKAIKKQMPAGYLLSVTIRLHQYKSPVQTGVPPADRGLLMAYNTGSLRTFGKTNSILDIQATKPYFKKEVSPFFVQGKAPPYPLQLDVALPLFSWSVLFSSTKEYAGLIRQLPDNLTDKSAWENIDGILYRAVSPQIIEGQSVPEGWYLRAEKVDKNTLTTLADILGKKLHSVDTVIFYHLDDKILREWSAPELKELAGRLTP